MQTPSSSDSPIPFKEALRVWTLVALQSFGGPAGQIAVMHRILVEEKRWVSGAAPPGRRAGPGDRRRSEGPEGGDRRQTSGCEILAQEPTRRPKKLKKSPAPFVHAATKAMRRELWEAYAWFVAAYRDAAERNQSIPTPIYYRLCGLSPTIV